MELLLLTRLGLRSVIVPINALSCRCPGGGSCTLHGSSRAVVFPGAAITSVPRVEAISVIQRRSAFASGTPPADLWNVLRMEIGYMARVHARCGNVQVRAVEPGAAPGNVTVALVAVVSVIAIPIVAVPLRRVCAASGPRVLSDFSVSGVARLRRYASERPLILGQVGLWASAVMEMMTLPIDFQRHLHNGAMLTVLKLKVIPPPLMLLVPPWIVLGMISGMMAALMILVDFSRRFRSSAMPTASMLELLPLPLTIMIRARRPVVCMTSATMAWLSLTPIATAVVWVTQSSHRRHSQVSMVRVPMTDSMTTPLVLRIVSHSRRPPAMVLLGVASSGSSPSLTPRS